MIINFTPADIKLCRRAAEARVNERIRANKLSLSEYPSAIKCHYSGTLGEYAVCKAYNCEWSGKYFEGDSWRDRTYDVGVGEVRATTRPEKEGGIRLYPSDDRLEAPYIWVAIRKFSEHIIRAELSGWIYHRDGRKPKWWDEDKGYWLVPREELKEMEFLPTQT